MGYLMMCVLSTRARQCARVVRLLCMVIRPPDPVATDRAGRRRAHAASWQPRVRPRWRLDARWIVDTLPRRPAAVDLARPGRANGHPADQVTRKRLERSRTMWETEDALQLVAVYRTQRRPWPMMAAQVGALLDAFPGLAAHDQLQGVTLVGRVRTDLFRHDIGALERHEIVGPRIDVFYTEHKCCGEDDLFGSGHAPETGGALALAFHAFKTGRRPSDATPAGAPAGETR